MFDNRPVLLEFAYATTRVFLSPFRRWLRSGGFIEAVFVQGEKITKGIVFDCKMCGDCVLHSTGMTCPMTCPKNLRNGPCGGVLANGHCEIVPEMMCVWVMAWERSKKMPAYGAQIENILPPLDRRLENSSAWINDFRDDVRTSPVGWAE